MKSPLFYMYFRREFIWEKGSFHMWFYPFKKSFAYPSLRVLQSSFENGNDYSTYMYEYVSVNYFLSWITRYFMIWQREDLHDDNPSHKMEFLVHELARVIELIKNRGSSEEIRK